MTLALSLLAGIATWSFLEYVIHRFLGHDRRFMPNPFGAEHTTHHSVGDYFAPWWKKAGTAVLATVLMAGPAWWVAGTVGAAAYIGGFVAFYLYYEILHRLEHVWEGLGPYGRWARRHHFLHHFHDPTKNHGVTSPIWDLVFGTYVKAEVVRVPDKLKMAWLTNPETGEVWPHLANRWQLRGRPLSPAPAPGPHALPTSG